MSVQAINPRIQLAERFVGSNRGPEIAVKTLFQDTIHRIETRMNTTLNEDVVKRVWKLVSAAKIDILKGTLIAEVASKMLGSCTDEEITKMMTETRQANISALAKKFVAHYPKIIDRIVKDAFDMRFDLRSATQNALQAEGITIT